MTPDRIRKLRDALQMTQEEFATRLGLKTRGAISRLESGKSVPKGPLLRLLEMLEAKTREKK